MTPILRMRDAGVVMDGEIVVPATSLDVANGAHHAHFCSNAREARAVAMLAAGIARCTQGSVLIGEYDPRVQPVHCKRIAAIVAHDPLVMAPSNFMRYIGYRAALWDLDAERARTHAALLLERLGDLHEAFAYPIVAALIAQPQLLVLDRPQLPYAERIGAVAGECAIFSTHVDMECAAAYGPLLEAAHA